MFQKPQKPMLIDPTLKICPHLIQNSCIIEAGLSDFHKMVITVIKTTFQKYFLITTFLGSHCRKVRNP